MKKSIVLASLVLTTAAYAGDNKNMISVDVGDVVRNEGSFNTNITSSSFENDGGTEGESNSVLINYAREVLPQVQVRAILGYSTSEELTNVAIDA